MTWQYSYDRLSFQESSMHTPTTIAIRWCRLNHLQSSLHLVQDSPGELVGASLATHIAGSRFAAEPEVLVTRQNQIRA